MAEAFGFFLQQEQWVTESEHAPFLGYYLDRPLCANTLHP